MVDPDSVRRRLREIDRRLSALGGIRDAGRDAFLADPDRQSLAERHLQLAIQAAIDIANHIVAEDSARVPEDYGSTFTFLAEMGVIHDELAGRLKEAAGLRNVLVHAYLDVDARQVWAAIERRSDLEEFARAVEAYVR